MPTIRNQCFSWLRSLAGGTQEPVRQADAQSSIGFTPNDIQLQGLPSLPPSALVKNSRPPRGPRPAQLVNVAGSVGGDLEKSTLAARTSILNHPVHGQLRVSRQAKGEDSNRVAFDLQLIAKDGSVSQCRVKFAVENSAPYHNGRSTLSSDEMDLEPSMRGKGVAALVLAEVALAGRQLGVDLIAGDNVVSDQMHIVCEKLGMSESTIRNSYEITPDALLLNAQARSIAKGWH
jgi:hypothetical protein